MNTGVHVIDHMRCDGGNERTVVIDATATGAWLQLVARAITSQPVDGTAARFQINRGHTLRIEDSGPQLSHQYAGPTDAPLFDINDTGPMNRKGVVHVHRCRIPSVAIATGSIGTDGEYLFSECTDEATNALITNTGSTGALAANWD